MSSLPTNTFHDTVSALAYSLAAPHAVAAGLQPPYNDLTRFILTQHAQMPDYLRAPMQLATLGFDAFGLLRGQPFHRQSAESRARQIAAWKTSGISAQRDLIRYFESLTLLSLYSRGEQKAPAFLDWHEANANAPAHELAAEIVVIGSGPGGAITACLLAEAGRKVLLIEEGAYLPLTSCTPFSREEMLQKYRNGGQTVALGKNKISYVEGRCVGGGSEINSGLYHRTPPEILENWRKDYQVQGLADADLSPHFAASESDLSVSLLPHPAPAASLKLHEGAAKLGWKSLEVPRWFRYAPRSSRREEAHTFPQAFISPPAEQIAANMEGQRQSMTETYLPRFLRAGGKLLSNTRALRLQQEGKCWTLETEHKSSGAVRVQATTVFVCAGAVHTPALLRRSGLRQNIGNTLQVHPTIKIAAQFPEAVNAADMGVPVHQVKEFSPRLSLGCSISSPAYVALGLLDHPAAARRTAELWQHTAIYYAMITSEGRGTVRSLPGYRDPLVRYRLTEDDRKQLANGLHKLAENLFAAGAETLYPGIPGGQTWHRKTALATTDYTLPPAANLMTIHLFSSCPMGEDHGRCATDSFGRVHGFKNLFINDASLLCTAPGVNPQGSVMAIARRNVLKFLGQ